MLYVVKWQTPGAARSGEVIGKKANWLATLAFSVIALLLTGFSAAATASEACIAVAQIRTNSLAQSLCCDEHPCPGHDCAAPMCSHCVAAPAALVEPAASNILPRRLGELDIAALIRPVARTHFGAAQPSPNGRRRGIARYADIYARTGRLLI